MGNRTFYNEILTEHNLNPSNRGEIKDANLILNGVNPSCGDDITLLLRVNDQGIIEDGGFTGDGCAISQASADMMLDLIIGEEKETALDLADIFIRMIKSDVTEEEKERLMEAVSLEDISHMPARVKCAELGWRTLQEMLDEKA